MGLVKQLENLTNTENKPNTPFWRAMKTKYTWHMPALVLGVSIPLSLALTYLDPRPVRRYLGMESDTNASITDVGRAGYTNNIPIYQSTNNPQN
jgi:hypothetical protein